MRGEYRQRKAKLAVWGLCLRQQLKVQSYRICVCLPGTYLAPDPALQVRVCNEIQIAAHQAGSLTGGKGMHIRH